MCGEIINLGRETIVIEGEDIFHSKCFGNNYNTIHLLYCGNCDNGPIMFEKIEDSKITKCINCGVYMYDAYEENL